MKHNYTPEFEALWSIYPKRAGSNPKIKAFKAFSARLKAGYDYRDMREGLERYAAYCVSKGLVGSEFLMQASTFFGPDEHFLEPWDLPKPEIKETIEQKGKRLGVLPRPGESMDQYTQRVNQAR